MKIKSMIAAFAASAIALSAMAVTASAAVFSKTGNGQEYYGIDIKSLDVEKIDKIVVEITCDTNYVKGTFGFNDKSTGQWAAHGVTDDGGKMVFISDAGKGNTVNDKWELSGLEGTIAEQDEIQVQFWWINPHYNADGSEGDKGTANIESVKLLDKDGNEVGAKVAETTTTAAETTTTTTTTGAGTTTTTTSGKKDDKKADSAKTGDAGVGVAVAALGLAGAAAFAARKKH